MNRLPAEAAKVATENVVCGTKRGDYIIILYLRLRYIISNKIIRTPLFQN